MIKRFYRSDRDKEIGEKVGKYGHISSGYHAHFAWLFKHIEGDLILDLGIGYPCIFSKFLAVEENKQIVGVDSLIYKKMVESIRDAGISLILCNFITNDLSVIVDSRRRCIFSEKRTDLR